MKIRIRNIQYFRAVSPLSRPIADATHSIDVISFIVTRLELESGVVGESNLLAFEYSPLAIAGGLHDLLPLAIQHEVWQTGLFVQRALAQTEYFGNGGLNRWAIGAINIAMWDAWGRTLGQPIWKILGTYRTEVPVYGSGGWLSYSIEEAGGRGFELCSARLPRGQDHGGLPGVGGRYRAPGPAYARLAGCILIS